MFEAIAENQGWSTALIGITTVFAALIVVSSAVALYAYLFRALGERKSAPAAGGFNPPVAASKRLEAQPRPAAVESAATESTFRADEAAVAIIAVAIQARRERAGARMAEAARNARVVGSAWSQEGRLRALNNGPR